MQPRQATNRPHVLLITVDHWSGSLLGCAGHPVVQTPTLDALARSGTRFSRAYSECPICIPARRTLMTGTAPRLHGDRSFQETLPMPRLTTLAEAFRAGGYQTYAAGKLHVYPQRCRIGFDDVALAEEGRAQFGVVDDYEDFLTREGFPGQAHSHGLSVNGYEARPWPLPEHCHPTNWITAQMMRFIKRRDPTRPGFWYLSYTHPHPPLAPLRDYLRSYESVALPTAPGGAWSRDEAQLPGLLLVARHRYQVYNDIAATQALRAFYALCTHVDHQLRLVLGTLREEGLLENTVILFTSDHGDMLGAHGCWAKRLFYEPSARVPMILLGPAGDSRVAVDRVDNRLVGLQDVMPTLLDLAGLPVPKTVSGQSMIRRNRRARLYGECGEGVDATRMIRQGPWKLVYYPEGNVAQLFHVETDPDELNDSSGDPRHREVMKSLRDQLRAELYGGDRAWVRGSSWRGLPRRPATAVIAGVRARGRRLIEQRGAHWPPPPAEPDTR